MARIVPPLTTPVYDLVVMMKSSNGHELHQDDQRVTVDREIW